MSFFTKTSIGYRHIKEGIPCQDYSDSYQSDDRTIITACDGHGGDIYIRSDRGAKFASDAIIDVLSNFKWSTFFHNDKEEISKQIGIQILCKWNMLVEQDLADNEIKESETAKLKPKEKEHLKRDPVTAYGTTVGGAMVIKNKIFCVSLGDGGCFLFRKGKIIQAFEDDGEQVANLTHSISQKDAYAVLNVQIFDGNKYDGVLICSDGVINPYGSVSNFEQYLAIPSIYMLLKGKEYELSKYIEQMGAEKGNGDDVSLSIVLGNNCKEKHYKAR